MSVVKVEQHDAFQQGQPVRNGLMDPRMGTVERTAKCETCFESYLNCPGHFGHLVRHV